ncbi:MAG: toprim domain-containing protein [Muribaculum sp.]|nr:toprim domain-containing protein [Muribaculum sp.]
MAKDTDITTAKADEASYTEENIRTLSWSEHIRQRPGMWVGTPGDGSDYEDALYVLFKEVIDNSVNEFIMGYGKKLIVEVSDGAISIRDFGRGIPLNCVTRVVSQINTGANYGSGAYVKSGGLNGVGIKAVNALSEHFEVYSVRNGRKKRSVFERAVLIEDCPEESTDEPNGTFVRFKPDETIFKDYRIDDDIIRLMLRNTTYVNQGLTVVYNDATIFSKNGLRDFIAEAVPSGGLYEDIYLTGPDIEICFMHTNQNEERFFSFANGQFTKFGGSHQIAFREIVARTIKDVIKKDIDLADIRNGMIAVISIRLENPQFQSQTKVKLNSKEVGPGGVTVYKFIQDFLSVELDNYLHRHTDTLATILKRAKDSARMRKDLKAISQSTKSSSRRVAIYNPKLSDCRWHLNNSRQTEDERMASSIFITEGDSAGGSIEKVRDVNSQAVFKLKGKTLNTYSATYDKVAANTELSLLRNALGIEKGIEGLRYNKVIIATDADVDGMHIRLLLVTFFLQYYPDLLINGNLYVLETPLFRVRDSKRHGTRSKSPNNDNSVYCYTDEERIAAINRFGDRAEITRFKGLGEISPHEFADFIGPDMRLMRLPLAPNEDLSKTLSFYRGKNTRERQLFIIENLKMDI